MRPIALTVPTNWDRSLLARLQGLPIYGLFGSLPQTPVDSGRARLILPQVSEAEARCHVDAAHAAGFGINYLVNAPCTGNMEFDETTHRALRTGFELTSHDPERCDQHLVITLGERASPYLRLIVEHLYSTLPNLRRHVFTAAGHVPHLSCPADFVANTLEFAARSTH